MKKIIELAEKALDASLLPGSEITQEMTDAFAEVGKAINKRRELEQTPITEDWLKEHGWKCTEENFYAENVLLAKCWEKGKADIIQFLPEDKYKGAFIIQSNEIESIQWLYDYCELCGINLED